MKVLVTGGAGFIGRWVVKKLLEEGHKVWVLDDLSNGQLSNLTGMVVEFTNGDIRDRKVLAEIFKNKFDVCIHAAAQINVQESLDNPEKSVVVNIDGTFNILEEARKYKTKVVMIGTCMVYDMADTSKAISENHPVKPASPYAASKLAAEELAMSYYWGYKLPVVILRPFNTYGPHQKSNMEGGVVSIFVRRNLDKMDLNIYGDGKQTRDMLYAQDCANFIVTAAFNEKAVGKTINAGSGKDVTVNELAAMICKDASRIKHVTHHHPQSEVPKLLCDYTQAKKLLNWSPKVSLEEGIKRTEEWIKNNPC